MDVLCLRLICSDIYIYSKIYNRYWLARSDHAEEVGRGDERVEGEHQERDEGQPQGAADLPVEGVRAEPRHPQVVARRGRRRRRHQEVRQNLVQEQAAVVARHAPEYEPGRHQAADLAERLRDRVGADDHVHRDGVPAMGLPTAGM